MKTTTTNGKLKTSTSLDRITLLRRLRQSQTHRLCTIIECVHACRITSASRTTSAFSIPNANRIHPAYRIPTTTIKTEIKTETKTEITTEKTTEITSETKKPHIRDLVLKQKHVHVPNDDDRATGRVPCERKKTKKYDKPISHT